MNANEEVFRQLERELFAAHEGTPDLAAIDRLYADDFVSTNADGRVVDKQGWLQMLRSGEFPVEKITTADFKARHYTETVVVTGRSAYFQGGTSLFEVRHSQVWADLSGRWRLVNWQGTPLPNDA